MWCGEYIKSGMVCFEKKKTCSGRGWNSYPRIILQAIKADETLIVDTIKLPECPLEPQFKGRI